MRSFKQKNLYAMLSSFPYLQSHFWFNSQVLKLNYEILKKNVILETINNTLKLYNLFSLNSKYYVII